MYQWSRRMRRQPAFGAISGRHRDVHFYRRIDRLSVESSDGKFAMKGLFAAFGSGLVFALGLGISGMTRPLKVIGFLDFFGAWDASLAFVMVGAIAVYFVAYRWGATGMRAPLLAPAFALPQRSDLDARLIGGAAIFGAGW